MRDRRAGDARPAAPASRASISRGGDDLDKPSSPLRTCVGCRSRDAADDLIRVVLMGSSVAVDLGKKSFGRGVWVHPRPECIRRACKGGLSQGFRREVSIDATELTLKARAAASRRVDALIAAARGARQLAIGADASKDACQSGQAALVVVARDLGSLHDQAWLSPWIVAGKALVWGDKEALGRILGRPDTGILAVTDSGLGQAVSRAIGCAQLPLPDARQAGVSESTEVR